MILAALSLTATTSSVPCLLGVSSARLVRVLASIASEAAMGVGSAVCRMAEGTRRVEDGLRGSARKGMRRRGCQHEQWVSSLAPERGGEGSGWGEGPLKKKEAMYR
jgi:hypothetical protein